MRGTSARFATAIYESHELAVEAKVIDATGAETPIDVYDGTVTLDATAATRASLDLTVDPEDLPTNASSLLAPYGNEIKVSSGIEFPDGTRELVPLGVPIHTAIANTILGGYPDCPMNFSTTALVTPALVAQEGDDRWDFCQGLAEAMGCDLYFDRDGVLLLRPAPTGLSPAVAQLVEGENGVLVTADRTWTRESAVNRVVVTGQNVASAAVYRGVATDDNPLSPTRYGGPFGRCTYPWSPSGPADSALTSDAQAAYVARVILAKKLGISQQVGFSTLVNPALEPYDVARITRARSGVDEDSILDSLSIPLSVEGAMSGNARASQVVT